MDYKAGEKLVESKPFVVVLTASKLRTTCSYCLKSTFVNLLRCSQCHLVMYCHAKCQKADWKCHKLECKGFQIANPRVPNTHARLVARILNKVRREVDQPSSETLLGVTRTFFDLKLHEDEIMGEDEHRSQIQSLWATLCNFMVVKPSFHDVKRAYCACVINCVMVSGEGNEETGSALYLGGSMFDHSCVPTAISCFNGRNVILRAKSVMKVKDKSDITISYCELLRSTVWRQKYLKEHYFFTCHCDRCEQRSPEMIGSFPEMIPEVTLQSLEKRSSLLEPGDMTEVANILEDAKSFLKSHCAELDDLNEASIRCHELIFDMSKILHRYDEDRYRSGLSLLKASKAVCGSESDLYVIYAIQMSHIAYTLKNFKKAQELAQEAEKIVREYMGGSEYAMYTTILRLVKICEVALSR